jgi:hypothetical protein
MLGSNVEDLFQFGGHVQDMVWVVGCVRVGGSAF